MYSAGKVVNNNDLTTLRQQAGPRVVNAIQTASRRTGVNFAYLMEKAAAESSFDAKAKSRSSSATGLFQFIESTWLRMVKEHGHDYGLGKYADQIDENGKCRNPQIRKEILELRKDPETAACLAAELASENTQYMQQHLDKDYGPIGATEMYLAHFLGAGGATAFLNEYKDNPMANAADLFPKAARANRNVFYDQKTGEARTLAGIYDFFARKFGNSGGSAPVINNIQVRNDAAPNRNRPAERQIRDDLMAQEFRNDQEALNILSSSPARKNPTRGYENRWAGLPNSPPNLVRNPAEVMIMARLNMPQMSDNNMENEERKNRLHYSQNRYN
jgi:hypothetical protein